MPRAFAHRMPRVSPNVARICNCNLLRFPEFIGPGASKRIELADVGRPGAARKTACL
jgi:hypothetical protein